jgi:nucleoside-diphosphate kinase
LLAFAFPRSLIGNAPPLPLHPDPLPLSLQTSQAAKAAPKALPPAGLPGTVHERTFIALKPDAMQRGLAGEIISRFEKKGFKLVAAKLIVPTKAQAEGH